MKFRTLTLLMTYKCNAQCDICLFNCDKYKDDIMNLNDAYRYIDEAFEIESFENLAISGGEPFLFYDSLIKICKKANQKGIPITISTNGFWAVNVEKARDVILELRSLGVTSLYISVDQFHAEYVSYECIKNILRAAKKISIRIDLHTIVTKNSLKLKDITKELDNEIMGYQIVQWPCIACGRAKTNIDENEFIYQETIPSCVCNNINTLVIDSYGKVFPCCGITDKSNYLSANLAKEHSIKEIIEYFNNNIYLKLLETYGARWFTEAIDKHNIDIKLKNKYTSLCELCGDLFSINNNENIYREAIEYEKQKLIDKYKLASNI